MALVALVALAIGGSADAETVKAEDSPEYRSDACLPCLATGEIALKFNEFSDGPIPLGVSLEASIVRPLSEADTALSFGALLSSTLVGEEAVPKPADDGEEGAEGDAAIERSAFLDRESPVSKTGVRVKDKYLEEVEVVELDEFGNTKSRRLISPWYLLWIGLPVFLILSIGPARRHWE